MPFRIFICSSASYVKYDPRIFLLLREVSGLHPDKHTERIKSIGLNLSSSIMNIESNLTYWVLRLSDNLRTKAYISRRDDATV